MVDTEVQIVSNEAGEQTAVIVPIALWREIEAERETSYLLSSDKMRERLLGALNSTEDTPLEVVIEKPGLQSCVVGGARQQSGFAHLPAGA